MLKVGILTFHNAVNYGAVLQTYALFNFVKKMNCEVQVINYCNDNIEKGKCLINKNFDTLKSFLGQFIMYFFRKRQNKKFELFINNFITLSETIKIRKDLLQLNTDIDYFIVGSDQVWNYELTQSDSVYFLDFVQDNNKKISYAASFGVENMPEEMKDLYTYFLNEFSRLGVREQQGFKILKDMGISDVYINLDPIFLLTKENWADTFTLEISNNPYILVYLIEDSPDVFECAIKLANRKKMKIKYISISIRERYPVEYLRNVGPIDFLKLFYNAAYIFTNSFHGIAFSINFNKIFWVKWMQNGTNSRLKWLIELTGLEDRNLDLFCCDEDKIVIDYSKVNKIIMKKRIESVIYLQESLKFCHK